jgi:hypothetical protein
MNNMALQIIPREHNFDFRHRTGEIRQANVKYPVSLVRQLLVAGITRPSSS